MSEISVWFGTKVSRWRSASALGWTLLVTPPVAYITLALANISFLHPLQWLYDFIFGLFALWTWVYIFLITISNGLLATQNARRYTVVPKIFTTRWEKLRSVVNLHSLYRLIWQGFISGFIAWNYTNLLQGHFWPLVKQCDEDSDDLCVNEHRLFVVVHSMFVGICYNLMASVKGRNHYTFPIIQQSKFFQLKSRAVHLVLSSSFLTLKRMGHFYLLYLFWLGYFFKDVLLHRFGVSESDDIVPLNSWSGWLDLSLFWHTLLSGSLIILLLQLSTTIYELRHTEAFEFPVEYVLNQKQNICLPLALRCKDSDMVMYAGFQDLYLLSKHSLCRRLQIFSLTHLGGHPQNWHSVSDSCMSLLREAGHNIAAYNTKIMANGSLRQLSGDRPINATESNSAFTGLRHRHPSLTGADNTTKLKKPTAFEMFIKDLKQRKLVAFFIAEDQDASSRKLFAKSQLYIWAVEAISYLVCASFAEDKFGVVQKSLPDVLDVLLNLQEQVEKHFRLVTNISKRSDKDGQDDPALRMALKATLKAAIYRIVTVFGSHIRSISMSSEHKRRLDHFLDYKE